MIKFLKALVSWLEKRFPEKLVITKADLDDLRARVMAVDEKRIKHLEDEIAKFNVALGFGAQRGMPGVMPFQR